jgi:hypothetical protein
MGYGVHHRDELVALQRGWRVGVEWRLGIRGFARGGSGFRGFEGVVGRVPIILRSSVSESRIRSYLKKAEE